MTTEQQSPRHNTLHNIHGLSPLWCQQLIPVGALDQGHYLFWLLDICRNKVEGKLSHPPIHRLFFICFFSPISPKPWLPRFRHHSVSRIGPSCMSCLFIRGSCLHSTHCYQQLWYNICDGYKLYFVEVIAIILQTWCCMLHTPSTDDLGRKTTKEQASWSKHPNQHSHSLV